MKFFKFLSALLIIATLFSCSSDGADSGAGADFFNLTYNGQTKNVTNWQGIKHGDFIDVYGTTDGTTGLGIDFKFNIYGNLYKAYTFPTIESSPFSVKVVSDHFSANTFTFQLIELNATDKTIRVNYEGKVYDDKFNHTSNFAVVKGSFKVTYVEAQSVMNDLGTYAELNGQAWHGLAFTTYNTSNSTVLNVKNDSEYEIGISYPSNAPVTGTFAFTSNADDNRIKFSKYEVATHSLIEYNVNGTITYTRANNNNVEGIFNLIATHPTNGSTITITNGTFSESSTI
ncbi:hypothetical protein [Flavobacterium sp. GT3R68]|uniref:hypothetical protein n=1 Tax=Flavobacterium sp. GT3R68 TaxID=2594437 RepID=UPI000F88EF1A|nr:hypothetical protein [Flavobacterium sp. GT3R68]RTY86475.1 hypothetical protein EKL32_27615 [Flavobacterium sp. GSN2]TRW94027.1 hypothetical protein FNW07_03695 [Flavobacterium sp. GT3R68]